MNRERVQMLRDMIAGIPENQVYLNVFYLASEPCVACIAGWAAIYPPFVERGFHKNSVLGIPAYGENRGLSAAAEFFDIPETIFDQHGFEPGTDKEIALRRLDKLLAK